MPNTVKKKANTKSIEYKSTLKRLIKLQCVIREASVRNKTTPNKKAKLQGDQWKALETDGCTVDAQQKFPNP